MASTTSPPSAEFVGYSVYIYDMEGNQLCSDMVVYHDKDLLQIGIKGRIPYGLKEGSICKLLFLAPPTPIEYQGRVIHGRNSMLFALFKGREKEARKVARYNINASVFIETYVCDRQIYRLLNPLRVDLLNISRNGVRFRAPHFSLVHGDVIQFHMNIGDGGDKLFMAEVVNHLDRTPDSTEYGCRFINSEKAV